jgi:hypothetical protein
LLEPRSEAEIGPVAPVVDERVAEDATVAVARAFSSRSDPPPATCLPQKIPGPPVRVRFLPDVRADKPTASKRAGTAQPMLRPRESSVGDVASACAAAVASAYRHDEPFRLMRPRESSDGDVASARAAAVASASHDEPHCPMPTRIPPHTMKRQEMGRPEHERDWTVDEDWER